MELAILHQYYTVTRWRTGFPVCWQDGPNTSAVLVSVVPSGGLTADHWTVVTCVINILSAGIYGLFKLYSWLFIYFITVLISGVSAHHKHRVIPIFSYSFRCIVLSSHIPYLFFSFLQLHLTLKYDYLWRLTGTSQLDFFFFVHSPVITFSTGYTNLNTWTWITTNH